jgi:hypothetical protein
MISEYYLAREMNGAKEAVCCPVDTHLADACALTKHRKCHVFIPSLMHACPHHGPWATYIQLSHAKVKSEFRRLKMGTCQLKEKTLTENVGPHRAVEPEMMMMMMMTKKGNECYFCSVKFQI